MGNYRETLEMFVADFGADYPRSCEAITAALAEIDALQSRLTAAEALLREWRGGWDARLGICQRTDALLAPVQPQIAEALEVRDAR